MQILSWHAAPSAAHNDALPPRRFVEAFVFLAGLGMASAMLGVSAHILVAPGNAGFAQTPTSPAVLALLWIGLFSALRWTCFFALSFWSYRSVPPQLQLPESCPLVSIIVPCHNEEQTIESALDSLSCLDYGSFEILAVDDGSKDGTLAKLRQWLARHPNFPFRILSKPNAGKWSALNLGFRRSQGELVLCVDADSRLSRSALRLMTSHMIDPAISAVAGQVRVRNRNSLITQLQAVEYVLGNGAVRLTQNLTQTVLVVPGPIGLFRRTTLEQVWAANISDDPESSARVSGPFASDTFAEDFDLSLGVLCLGGRIVYEPRAISFTKAPDSAFRLMNQRYRWIRGSMQVLQKFFRRVRSNKKLLLTTTHAWVLLTYLPELVLLPAVSLFGTAFIFTNWLFQPVSSSIVIWVVAYLLLQELATLFYALIHRESLSLLRVVPLYFFYNCVLLSCAWLISLADELRQARMRW